MTYTPQADQSSLFLNIQPRQSYRLLVTLQIFDKEESQSFQKPIDVVNVMIPAQSKLTIAEMLLSIDQFYSQNYTNKKQIQCNKALVEDHYEVDLRYSVGECFNDNQKVLIKAVYGSQKVNKASQNNKQSHQVEELLVGKKRNAPESVAKLEENRHILSNNSNGHAFLSKVNEKLTLAQQKKDKKKKKKESKKEKWNAKSSLDDADGGSSSSFLQNPSPTPKISKDKVKSTQPKKPLIVSSPSDLSSDESIDEPIKTKKVPQSQQTEEKIKDKTKNVNKKDIKSKVPEVPKSKTNKVIVPEEELSLTKKQLKRRDRKERRKEETKVKKEQEMKYYLEDQQLVGQGKAKQEAKSRSDKKDLAKADLQDSKIKEQVKEEKREQQQKDDKISFDQHNQKRADNHKQVEDDKQKQKLDSKTKEENKQIDKKQEQKVLKKDHKIVESESSDIDLESDNQDNDGEFNDDDDDNDDIQQTPQQKALKRAISSSINSYSLKDAQSSIESGPSSVKSGGLTSRSDSETNFHQQKRSNKVSGVKNMENAEEQGAGNSKLATQDQDELASDNEDQKLKDNKVTATKAKSDNKKATKPQNQKINKSERKASIKPLSSKDSSIDLGSSSDEGNNQQQTNKDEQHNEIAQSKSAGQRKKTNNTINENEDEFSKFLCIDSKQDHSKAKQSHFGNLTDLKETAVSSAIMEQNKKSTIGADGTKKKKGGDKGYLNLFD